MKFLKVLLIAAAFLQGGQVIISGRSEMNTLRLNSFFTDHMVIQRNAVLNVYGQAKPGAPVKVEFAGIIAETKAGKNGSWKAEMQPVAAGGPHEMTVSSGSDVIRVSDILAGDVWFCSGQSNMEWIMMNTDDGAEELKNFTPNERIRLFTQEQVPAPSPLEEPAGKWTACDAENVKLFSAVAYFFGKRINADTGVPVGLINSSWGGTPIEIWMDENLLASAPETEPILNRWKNNPVFDWKTWNNGKGMNYELEIAELKFMPADKKAVPLVIKLTDSSEAGIGGAWYGWAKPGSITNTGAKGRNGLISGLIGFNAWAGAGTLLNGGADVDLSKYETMLLKVRGNAVFSLSLCQKTIEDYDYYSTQDYNAKDSWQEIEVPFSSLRQGGWGRAKPITINEIRQIQFNIKSMTVELPSALYNGMVAPFSKFPVKGFVWYQGESNAGRAYQYRVLLPMMINNWRKIWGAGSLPFLAVQLPNFMERKAEPSDSWWAELREAQLMALNLPGTAVVSTIDIGDPKDIHPRIKKPVSDRLAQAALNVAYGKDAVPMGPVYDSMKAEGNRIIISFKHTGSGLKSKDWELKGFSIAGSDKKFVWAKAEIKDGRVYVWNDDVKEPAAVRYAWADNPEAGLYNQEGLAASPFRTDEWTGITAGIY